MGIFKKAGLVLSSIALAVGISSNAYSRNFLRVSYSFHKSHILKGKSEISLKVPVRKGVSYSVLVKIFTGSETNVPAVQAFNDNKPLIYVPNPNPKGDNGFIYIQKTLLSPTLKKVLDENNFTTFEIDNQGDEGIPNLWEVGKEFMKDTMTMNDKINILLALNDEVNPVDPIVYNGQKILVPVSLVDETLAEEEKQQTTPVKPIPKTEEKQSFKPVPPPVKIISGTQNPLKESLSKLKVNMKSTDKFNSRRMRGSKKRGYKISKHTGIDLVAPVGTALYSIKQGVVVQAGREPDKKFRARNGNVVAIKLDGTDLIIKYIHLKETKVKIGQHVDINTVVGKVGTTGNAKGTKRPHVHVGLRKGTKLMDPTPYVLIGA